MLTQPAAAPAPERNITRLLCLPYAHLEKPCGTAGTFGDAVEDFADQAEPGMFMYVPDDPDHRGIPQDLCDIFHYALTHGCSAVLFQTHASRIPELRTYDEDDDTEDRDSPCHTANES